MNIPPWLSMAQRLRDSALKVEILRDEKAQREMKALADGDEPCAHKDRELMLAEINYREQLLTFEAQIRKIKCELKRTKLPVNRPLRDDHPNCVVANGQCGGQDHDCPVESPVETSKAESELQKWQRMADEYQRTMFAVIGGQPVAIDPRPKENA